MAVRINRNIDEYSLKYFVMYNIFLSKFFTFASDELTQKYWLAGQE